MTLPAHRKKNAAAPLQEAKGSFEQKKKAASAPVVERLETSASSIGSSPKPFAGPDSDQPPKIHWQRGKLLGQGTFGKVFMGMNEGTGELIAVKTIELKTKAAEREAKEVENEILLLQKLRHPNIVSLLGVERSSRVLNIIMEYVPGNSLDLLLKNVGAFPEQVIRKYTFQLVSALAFCHRNGVIHRDIKGQNILVDVSGNLKIADFGSAKLFQNVQMENAPSVSYNYTPLWTAPEVLQGKYNSKVDVWSLGCVLLEMCTAKLPWSEHNFTHPFQALYIIANNGISPEIPTHFSPELKSFVLSCMTRDVQTRPSCDELFELPFLKGFSEKPYQEKSLLHSSAVIHEAGSRPVKQLEDDQNERFILNLKAKVTQLQIERSSGGSSASFVSGASDTPTLTVNSCISIPSPLLDSQLNPHEHPLGSPPPLQIPLSPISTFSESMVGCAPSFERAASENGPAG